NGTTNLGDGTTIASSNGVASVQTGALRLTSAATTNTRSSFRIPALADSAEGWIATFEFLLSDNPGGNPPADGFSFNYGAIPAFNAGQGNPAAADAHGNAEEGWNPSVNHLSFEVDSWRNFDNEQGFNMAVNGTDIAFENQGILNDGQSISGQMEVSWNPASGASMSVDLGFGLAPVFTNVATPGFVGSNAYSFAFSARTGGATETLTIDNLEITSSTPTLVILPEPVISEFLADNDNTIDDEDCKSSDWLEIFNATANPVDFGGWFLTDDPAMLTKWQIPTLVLAANQRKLIFASGKDQTVGELHTSFSIQKAGGYLALVKPDGTTIASSYNFGQQIEDVSYGTLGQAQTLGFFGTPTPGTTNRAPQGLPVTEKPVFSLDDQVITGTVNLVLTATSPTATIRYTTNGNDPTETSPIYTSPISFSSTTRVTARIYETGLQPGPTRSRTYLRLSSDIQSFTSDLPVIIIESFGVNIDGEASSNSQSPRRPVQSIFLDVNPGTGRTSVLDVPDFTGRGGMRVRGQTSSGFAKKQYSFETWDSDDNDKDVSIFGMPSESDWIIHAPYSDKTLMRNKIVYDYSRALGYPAVRTRFCELFFNSNGGNVSMNDYRGVYVFMEKIKRNEDRVNIKNLEACHISEPAITGGYLFKKDKGQTVDVTFTTSQEGHQMAFVEPDTPNAQQQAWLDNYVDSFENALHGANFDDPVNGYAKYIDVDSFIDAHIWVELFKNIDGYRLSNYFYKDRGRKLVASPVWDYNLSLGNANYLEGQNATGWYYPQVSSQQYPFYSRLFQDPEFVARYWDRWYELRDGMFGTARMLTLIDTYTAEIAEGAVRNFNKWNNLLGNYTWPNADGYASRTTHQAEVDWMKTWLSTRLDWIDGQHAKPPVYNLASGSVSPGSMLTMTNPNSGGGTIHYTTDGSDPRVPGNATNNTLLPAGSSMRWIIPTSAITNWNTVGGPANLASWGTGNAGIGYENSPADYAGMINTTVPSGTTSVYTRFTFNIPDQATIDAFDTLSLNIRYDDGFVAYLNGAKVASPNAPVSPVYNSTATDQHVDSAAVNYEPIDITVYLGQLQVGTNVLAIQLLNRGTTSSDLLLDPQVVGGNSGALISPTAQVYGGAFPLNSSQTVQARTLAPTGWSAMETETFLVSSQPASSTNLAVSEFNYRPGVPTPAEIALGFDVRTDFEYLEIMNISAVDVDLAGVQFTTGVQFEFDLGEVPFLSPGERVLIVSNRSAFEQRYAPQLSGFRIAGEFTNNLSNDGETVILSTGGGTDIRNFTYNDVAPWPEAADGSGRSLVLRNPANDPDHNLPGNWRASSSPNGSPGTEDLTGGYADWAALNFTPAELADPLVSGPEADPDEDGLNNLAECYFHGNPSTPDPSPGVIGEHNGLLSLTFTRRTGASAHTDLQLYSSTDLVTWNADPLAEIATIVDNGDGSETVTLASSEVPSTRERLFLRIQLSLKE
ncbi:MAG: CotH kinase family protein, partial [Roseibacillus sp.]